MINPELFSRNLGPIVDITKKIYDKHQMLLKWNYESESVLDVGIGDGMIAKKIIIPSLPTNFKEFLGCDISEEALDSARERIKMPNCHLINMDISSKNIQSEYKNRFDHIFCNRCLHNLHDITDLR